MSIFKAVPLFFLCLVLLASEIDDEIIANLDFFENYDEINSNEFEEILDIDVERSVAKSDTLSYELSSEDWSELDQLQPGRTSK